MLKAIYDDDFPCDYYTLTFSVFESEVKLQNTFADKTPFSSKYWGFKRPGPEVGAYFYKGSVCEFYLYGFSKEWAERNFSFGTLPEENQIKKFLNSDKGFITYQDIVPRAAELSKEVWGNLEKNNQDLFDLWLHLNRHILEIIKNQTDKTLDYQLILPNGTATNLQFLIEDYIEHLFYHVSQINKA